MPTNPSSLITYLSEVNLLSKFSTYLGDRGGYITFSNSGQRGSVKSFTLGLDSFIYSLKDIKNNIAEFKDHSHYAETKWRDLGAEYFSDEPANAMSTVQTKPLFTTLSKLIAWANNKNSSLYIDNEIDLTPTSLDNAISELEALAELYSPVKSETGQTKTLTEKLIISEKELKQFAFKVFKVLLNKYGFDKVVKFNATEKDSTINTIQYTGLKFKSYFGSGNLIGAFDNEQDKEALTSSNTQRFFEENLNLKEYPYSYFSTQWGDVENGTLSFSNLQNFISEISNNTFEANKAGDIYSLTQIISSNNPPLQKIFYGAPGTGKSHKIEAIIENIPEDQKERVTFHPEYDYSSFVGGYRPYSEKKGDEYVVTYKFIPQVFTNIYVKAWQNPDKDYYLAIEEINRGNCAEIFGDLFQLLDRNSNYNISPSKDLLDYLKQQFTGDAVKGIEGDKMRLPSNLHFLASMNTSDQSLFPMDSAFKRRWSWEYVPVNYEENVNGVANPSYNFQVELGSDKRFKWIDFIQKVNQVIKLNPNLGLDKCLGNYFIKPFKNIITLEEFINKAIFYLWIDVFKDEEDSIFKSDKDIVTYEDFFPVSTLGMERVKNLLDDLEVSIIDIEEE